LLSGSTGGGAGQCAKFASFLRTSQNWTKCQFPSVDQPIVNWLVWTGQLRVENIKYDFRECGKSILMCKYCAKFEYGFNENGLIFGNTSRLLIFLHQYNRIPELAEYVSRVCHVNA
jgi:hypothetical protein